MTEQAKLMKNSQALARAQGRGDSTYIEHHMYARKEAGGYFIPGMKVFILKETPKTDLGHMEKELLSIEALKMPKMFWFHAAIIKLKAKKERWEKIINGQI